MKKLSADEFKIKARAAMHKLTHGFILVVIYELIEEGIEEAIAIGVSAIFAGVLSFVITAGVSFLAKTVVVKTLITIIKPIVKQFTYKKGADKMEKIKTFFKTMGTNMKNNPVTILTVFIEALLCSAGGVGLDYIVKALNWLDAPWNYVVAAAATIVIFLIIAILTVYLGFDNKDFAKLRGIVKIIGGDKAVESLDGMVDVVLAAKEAEEARLAAEKAQKEEDDRIYAQILAEEKEAEAARIAAEKAAEQAKIDAEKAKIEAERRAKIDAYKAAHAAASTIEKETLM
jgi:hypothetical protein